MSYPFSNPGSFLDKQELKNKITPVYITSLVLHYPFAISVGNDENLGVRIWNLLDCSLIRNMLTSSNLYPVICNRYMFCVTDGKCLFAYNFKDTLNKKVKDEDIKEHTVHMDHSKEYQSIAMNHHSLLTYHLHHCTPSEYGYSYNCHLKLYDIKI